MAITKGRKSFAEVNVQESPFLKVTGIVAPHEEWEVVGYLPVDRLDAINDEYFVIEGGRVVAITARTEARFLGKLDLANGGTAQDVTYTANDVGIAEDVASPDNLVSVAGNNVGARLANIPIGLAKFPVYNGTIKDRLRNFELQPVVTVLNQGYWEFPIIFTDQDTGGAALVEGGLVRPGDVGELVRWVNGVDSVEQLIGRCWRIRAIAAEGGLDKVHTVKGLGLAGTDTAGIPQHLVATKEAGGAADTMFRVVINAAP
jgi:hypothetical protein